MRAILMRMFIRPRGLLGRLGGRIMARNNAPWGVKVSDLLQVAPTDRVLEVGFGPGVVIDHLSKLAGAGVVVGIDTSREMLAQARVRNMSAIRAGGVDLRYGSVEHLPFDDNSFDKVLAINSMQVWPDAVAGLREIRRVLRSGGTFSLVVIAQNAKLFNRMYGVCGSLAPAFWGRQVEHDVPGMIRAAGMRIVTDQFVRQGFYPSRILAARRSR